MEELAAAFSGSVGVSFSADSAATQHPRLCLYKSRYTFKENQDERRRKVLQAQKDKRKDYSNIARKLAEDDWHDITLSDDEDDGKSSSTPTSPRSPTSATSPTSGSSTKKKQKKERYYSNQLMLSEWLVDVPSDLAENWLMVPCPVGKRTFLLATRGKTQHYTKSGFCITTFQSFLPGGSGRSYRGQSNYTILDCIYSSLHRTYYVLDIMCWSGHPVYDSDTEFRFFWLQSKLSENPELATGSKKYPIKFVALPSYPCQPNVMREAMFKPMPFQDELDGLLFYHKALHYVPGVTPLVGWLKPWMLPEILSVPIPQSLKDKAPPGASLRPPSSMETQSSPSPSPSKTETTGGMAPSDAGDKPSSMETESASVSSPGGVEAKGDSTQGAARAEPSSMETESLASSSSLPAKVETENGIAKDAAPEEATSMETQSSTSSKGKKNRGKKNKGGRKK